MATADPMGPLLKRARQEAGIERKQVADLLSLSESHLRNLENGFRHLTPDLHRQIADALTALGADPSTLPKLPGEHP